MSLFGRGLFWNSLSNDTGFNGFEVPLSTKLLNVLSKVLTLVLNFFRRSKPYIWSGSWSHNRRQAISPQPSVPKSSMTYLTYLLLAWAIVASHIPYHMLIISCLLFYVIYQCYFYSLQYDKLMFRELSSGTPSKYTLGLLLEEFLFGW